ncbi:MAG: hypothetical protein ACOY93_17230 [Bacillota bacterium]
MDHERGKDPTPRGRMPAGVPEPQQKPLEREPGSDLEARYASSAPGPDDMEDGAAFFGYKRENAHPSNPAKQP